MALPSKNKKAVPKKNVMPILIDVKRADYDYRQTIRFAKLNLVHALELQPKKPGFVKKVIMGGLATGALILAALIVFTVKNLKGIAITVLVQGEQIANNFTASVASLKAFKPQDALPTLRENETELKSLEARLFERKTQLLVSTLGSVVPAVKEAGSLFRDVTDLNLNFLKLSATLAELQENGFQYFRSDGQKLLELLRMLQESIQRIHGGAESVRNKTTYLKKLSPSLARFDELFKDDYLTYSAELKVWERALTRIFEMLEAKEDKHILLLFQNPSEIRPGGGFVGSYGDLIIKGGQMVNLVVQDIYWPDHPKNFSLKVIPPEPLQRTTEDWGARDANWFFDFPTSAKTVASFLEASKVYAEPKITFEGVIGVNINVLRSILELVGPIPIEEYDLTIDKNNFLIELQREVEAGRDKKPGKNPKRVLAVLAPILLDRLHNLGVQDQKILAEKVEQHVKHKDIMFSARDKDAELASFLKKKQIDGSVYELPNDFWGTYLAVVNANVAGGKSDAFIEERIDGKIDIDRGGSIFTALTIERSHKGKSEKDPWWRADNKNFIQIFTNPASTLVDVKGNTPRQPVLKGDYKERGYSENPDLKAIEDTQIFLTNHNAWSLEEFGKKVFATWFVVGAGETKVLEVRYQTPASSQLILDDGALYQFVFERQSGVKSKLNVTISAPLGFSWLESQGPIYVYETDDPERRVVIHLTLKKGS